MLISKNNIPQFIIYLPQPYNSVEPLDVREDRTTARIRVQKRNRIATPQHTSAPNPPTTPQAEKDTSEYLSKLFPLK